MTSILRRVAAQTRVELMLTVRRGEALIVTVAIPIGILVFFSGLQVLPHGGDRPVDFLTPGVMALTVVASAMTALAIATGFERQQGVLKRMGATPLGRSGLVSAKVASIAVIVVVQWLAVTATGWTLGWRPASGAWWAVALGAMGTVAFGGIGMAMAGTLRAEATLALANLLFLVMLLLGGIVVPVDSLPGILEGAARILPAEPLATGLRHAFEGEPVPVRALVVLGAWALGATAVAATTFRWD